MAMDAIKAIRNIKAEKNVAPSKKIKVILLASGDKKETMQRGETYLKNLANITEITFADSKSEVPADAVSAVIDGAEIYIPLDDLVDFAEELARLEKEEKRLQGEVKRSTGMLSNPGFVNKAPEAKIRAEKEKLAMYEEMLTKVSAQLASIKEKLS